MKSRKILTRLMCVLGAAMLWSCSSVRHVPQGSYLVDHVKINMTDKPDDLTPADLTNYLRQTPNHKVFGFLKLQLATYNMSGRDSTRWYNRWLRRMGQPPVIYDQALTDASVNQLRLALINRGYMDADVTSDTIPRPGKKKIDVVYNITAGRPHRISSITYDIPDSAVSRVIMRDSARFTLKPGDRLNRDELDAERTLMAERLRNRGYYSFSKEYITFYADTVAGSKDVDLTMTVRMPQQASGAIGDSATLAALHHDIYRFRKVVFLTDYRLGQTLNQTIAAATDTIEHRGYTFLYGKDRWLTPGTMEEKCFITPGRRYSSRAVDMTYEYLSRLGIVKSINIELRPAGNGPDGEPMLDAYIMLTRNKKQGITFDVEGTNSEGDFGFGVGLTYQHRNLAHRSRLLTVKFRTSYESLSGNLDGLINNNYQEYAGEVGVTFPKFAFPFLSRAFKKRIKAQTEVALSFNYQERPEYTRIIAGAAWKYRWTSAGNLTRRTLDLININYVRLPRRTLDFLDQIAPTNPLLRYSYEDHFIMDIGYTFYHTNRRLPGTSGNRKYVFQPVVYTIRAAAETAGNLLRAYSAISGQQRDDGVYKVFGIQYSQYAKAEVDYSIVRNFTPRHSLAFHVGGGIGVPYGNSTALPFEKRFYAGGANGVRGWSVRTLGPGKFDGRNRVTDFINQCGDIMLILSAEYRAKLFWIIEGALFVDAGNIWTIRDYENQPGGVFRFNEFYKQIAASYGLGLRLDFTYFLLRFDLGLKAVNPAMNQERWPIIHPDWHRDATFHFAVGYPF